MKPSERQLWRVLNASAITYLNLAVLFQRAPQQLGIVAIDGVPLNENGNAENSIEWRDRIGVPPGSRVEFIVSGPPLGVTGLLVTRTWIPDPAARTIRTARSPQLSQPADAPEPRSDLERKARAASASRAAMAGERHSGSRSKVIFFRKAGGSKKSAQRDHLLSHRGGQTPAAFDPNSAEPNIIVKQGDVEDWIIENRSNELHDFHIHQLHFMLVGLVRGTCK